MVEGLFLHVFEDSMVNYLFFEAFGLLCGVLFVLARYVDPHFTDDGDVEDEYVEEKNYCCLACDFDANLKPSSLLMDEQPLS